MRNILKLTYLIIIIIFPYLFIIFSFPTIWDKIDSFIWIDFNYRVSNWVDSLFDKIWKSKDSTNYMINSVWENTKNKTIEQRENIEDIIDQ